MSSPATHITIQKFWAEEWGCEYKPETQQWLDLTTGRVIRSEAAEFAKRKAWSARSLRRSFRLHKKQR
jgi:hypothetical protein